MTPTHRPDDVHAVAFEESDPSQTIEHRAVVAAIPVAAGGIGPRRMQIRPLVLAREGRGGSQRRPVERSSLRAVEPSGSSEEALHDVRPCRDAIEENVLPARPQAAAASRSDHSMSNACATARAVGSATSPVTLSSTNSSGPPLSVRVTTGRSAAYPSIVTYP